MPFNAGRKQRNANRTDAEKDSEQVEHWSTRITIDIGNERVRAGVQAASTKSEQDRSHTRSCERVRKREPYHCCRNERARNKEVCLTADVINQWPNHEGSAENAQVKQQK